MNSKINLFQSVQLRYYKASKQYKKRNLPVDHSKSVKNASRVLVCLPVETLEVVAAYQFVEDINRKYVW